MHEFDHSVGLLLCPVVRGMKLPRCIEVLLAGGNQKPILKEASLVVIAGASYDGA